MRTPQKQPANNEGDSKKRETIPKRKKVVVCQSKMHVPALWREVAKFKSLFQGASSTFAELDSRIKHDEAWKWFKGDSHTQLLEHQAEVKAATTDWQREFLISADIQTFKKGHLAAKSHTELVTFLSLSQGPISKLAEYCAKL